MWLPIHRVPLQCPLNYGFYHKLSDILVWLNEKSKDKIKDQELKNENLQLENENLKLQLELRRQEQQSTRDNEES